MRMTREQIVNETDATYRALLGTLVSREQITIPTALAQSKLLEVALQSIVREMPSPIDEHADDALRSLRKLQRSIVKMLNDNESFS